jgi:hypothetical protein
MRSHGGEGRNRALNPSSRDQAAQKRAATRMALE